MAPVPLSSSYWKPSGGTIRRRVLAAMLLSLTIAVGGTSTACADLPAGSFVFSGAVKSIAATAQGTYVAGQFGGQKAPTGNGLIVGALGAGTPNPAAFEHVAGPVTAVVSDGASGWYIGGEFTAVGDAAISNLAHIKADGTLDAGWVPDPDGAVETLARVGSSVYVGGAFTRIGGKARNGVAAISATTASATAFDPALIATDGWDLSVDVIAAVSPSEVVIGGAFASAGGQPHRNIVKVDGTTGAPKSWNPNLDQYGSVLTVAVSGSTLYLGGGFEEVGGQTRHGLGAVDLNSGAVLGWNPSSPEYSYVRDIEAVGSTLYVGGDFTSMGGATRNGVAELSAATGAATAWNPNIPVSSTFVTELEVTASAVYIGGFFGDLGGQPRANVGAVDRTSGQALPWNPQLATNVSDSRITGLKALAVDGTQVYVGGYFAGAGPNIASIQGIARLNADGSLDTDWDTEVDGTVNQVVATATSLYVLGNFYGFGDATFIPRRNLAALDPANGSVRTAFTADLTGYYFEGGSLSLSGSTLYVGGCLQAINGTARKGIGAVDATTGTVTSWNPGAPAGACVNRVAAIGSTVYVAGFFSAIGGQNRAGIAGLDATTANATAWAPQAGFNAIASSSMGLILGGNGNTGAGVSPLSAVNPTTGAQVPWTTSLGGIPEGTWVSAVAVSPTAIYAGGPFWKAGGLSRPRVASFSPTTGAPTSWNPGADDEVVALALDGSDIHLGGAFTAVDGRVTGSYAKVRNSGAPDDRRGPYIAVANLADGQAVAQGAAVTPGLTCDDGVGSGVSTCSSPGSIDTATTGPHTFTATATDNAGNTSTRTIAYMVGTAGPTPNPGGPGTGDPGTGAPGGGAVGGSEPGGGGDPGPAGNGGAGAATTLPASAGPGPSSAGASLPAAGAAALKLTAPPSVKRAKLRAGITIKVAGAPPGAVAKAMLLTGRTVLASSRAKVGSGGGVALKLRPTGPRLAKARRAKRLSVRLTIPTPNGGTRTVTRVVRVL